MSEDPAPAPLPRLMEPLRVARLGGRKKIAITLTAEANQRAQIAAFLGLEALRKLRFDGVLQPLHQRDWELKGTLGASVVQSCAVTLAPVSTRIDEPVHRQFIADLPEPDGLELEMPEDDTLERLRAEIDVSALVIEALSLALPGFVRAPDAELSASGVIETGPPGAAPLEAERPNPFAALAVLKSNLGPAQGAGEDAPPKDSGGNGNRGGKT